MTDLQKIEAVLKMFGVKYQKGSVPDGTFFYFLQYADLVLYFDEDGELTEVEK